jgi:hypothetical protein
MIDAASAAPIELAHDPIISVQRLYSADDRDGYKQ